ncbi:MAG: SDR family oxidoreductase [Colwellia sp.]|nr:SDR family oxidoreductase [Colwellia sp.]MCW8863727.1 SDR family oxidoreductase [Colwellia sp.]MCW9081366.1 SDR family oxidoreductase [Colwellia sp.]
MRLKDKVVVVTGGAQGLGRIFCEGLAQEGAKVIVADILSTERTVNNILAAGGEAIGAHVDVSDDKSIAAMSALALKTWGTIDILVNNAAIYSSLTFKSFLEIDCDEWDAVMRVNVRGCFQAAKGVVPIMKKQQSGKIINICSGAFYDGVPMFLHYVSSKGAVLGLTRALARELGDDNICVNAISPGLTESEGVSDHEQFSGPSTDHIVGMRAIKRRENPEDLLGALIFLSSDESSFVTGQSLLVDGGSAMN